MKEEMKKLNNYLIKNHIDHEVRSIFENEDQIIIKKNNIKKLSCISHLGSYGGLEGLIEIWNFKDDPIGYLTAEDCYKIIKKLKIKENKNDSN